MSARARGETGSFFAGKRKESLRESVCVCVCTFCSHLFFGRREGVYGSFSSSCTLLRANAFFKQSNNWITQNVLFSRFRSEFFSFSCFMHRSYLPTMLNIFFYFLLIDSKKIQEIQIFFGSRVMNTMDYVSCYVLSRLENLEFHSVKNTKY